MPPQTAINPSHCRVFSEEQLAIALDTTFVSNFLRQSQPGTPKSTRARARAPAPCAGRTPRTRPDAETQAFGGGSGAAERAFGRMETIRKPGARDELQHGTNLVLCKLLIDHAEELLRRCPSAMKDEGFEFPESRGNKDQPQKSSSITGHWRSTWSYRPPVSDVRSDSTCRDGHLRRETTCTLWEAQQFDLERTDFRSRPGTRSSEHG